LGSHKKTIISLSRKVLNSPFTTPVGIMCHSQEQLKLTECLTGSCIEQQYFRSQSNRLNRIQHCCIQRCFTCMMLKELTESILLLNTTLFNIVELTLSFPESVMHTKTAVRFFDFLSLWMKSYGVTIQMKPLQLYFHVVLFIFMYFP